MVAHYRQVCDNYSVVEQVAAAHNLDHMEVACMIQVAEHFVSAVVDTVGNL